MRLELLPLIPPGPAWRGLLWPAGRRRRLVVLPNPAAAGPSAPPGLATATLAIVPTTLGGTVPTGAGRLPLRSGACVGLSAVASG